MVDKLLTPREVMDEFRVSRHTLTRWAKLGLLPEIRVSERITRYRRDDVERLLEPQDPTGDP
jgi:DNA-binding transcriptional MerR regulator